VEDYPVTGDTRRSVAKALRELRYVLKARMSPLDIKLCRDWLYSAAKFLDDEQDAVDRFFTAESTE
jgi:hypothetical protein